jgi:hypothetical protein
MNWDAIGAIGELIGSLAVVITIAYLVIQIRQNNKSAKSVSTNQSRAAAVDVISAITNSTDAITTYTAGLNNRIGLEIHERVRFDLIIFQTLKVTETIFLEYMDGLLTKEQWDAQWRGEKHILQSKGGRESWAVQKTFVSASYMKWVDENLDID